MSDLRSTIVLLHPYYSDITHLYMIHTRKWTLLIDIWGKQNIEFYIYMLHLDFYSGLRNYLRIPVSPQFAVSQLQLVEGPQSV